MNIRFTDVNIPVGHYCRKFRKSKGLTLEEVATGSCTNTTLVSHFENGNRSSIAILLYYISIGMSPDGLMKYCENYNSLMEAIDYESNGIEEV